MPFIVVISCSNLVVEVKMIFSPLASKLIPNSCVIALGYED
jgi:hypothetical protein